MFILHVNLLNRPVRNAVKSPAFKLKIIFHERKCWTFVDSGGAFNAQAEWRKDMEEKKKQNPFSKWRKIAIYFLKTLADFLLSLCETINIWIQMRTLFLYLVSMAAILTISRANVKRFVWSGMLPYAFCSIRLWLIYVCFCVERILQHLRQQQNTRVLVFFFWFCAIYNEWMNITHMHV